jgi:para-nitrobenzyl esterase
MTRGMKQMAATSGLLMALLTARGWTVPARESRPVAQTPCMVALANGEIQGRDLGSACAFLGVPYGASTEGSNRWRAPQPSAPWDGVLNVTGIPVQPVGCASVSFFGNTPSFGGTESCLLANLWAPDPMPATAVPVLVWLHTGAFTGASGNFAGHRGPVFAAQTGVIVVSPNYRVGPFGFLAHQAFAAESPSGAAGNYGLLDQQAALRWVRDNIAQFGGDPSNVTIAGTSAGGQSVGFHLVSPGSAGLFHRAIVQSAYPTSAWRSAAEAREQGEAFATALGCANAACMRAAASTDVLTALAQGAQQVSAPSNITFWEPTVDGVVVPDQPRRLIEAGAFHRVPTIVGVTRDEGWGAFITRSFPQGVDAGTYEGWVMSEFGPYAADILALYASVASVSPHEAMARVVGDVQFVCEARRLARAIERTGAPAYVYSYEHVIDTLSPGRVIHGVERNILFGNNYGPPLPAYMLNDVDRELHRQMAGYWARFAATGNPNRGGEDSFSWPPFKRPAGDGRGNDKYLVLRSVLTVGDRLRDAQCDYFEPLFLRSVLGGLPAATPF